MNTFINNNLNNDFVKKNDITRKNDTIIDTSIFINVNDAILTNNDSVNNNNADNINNEDSNVNNNVNENSKDNINSSSNDNSTELENVNNIIIQILEDHGYKGIDLLNQLSNIYDTYQAKFIKLFKIQNYTYFTILKDTIWYNWENEDKKKGVSSLKYFGTKFPYITHLFDGVNIVPNIYLHNLNTEIEQIINLWKETDKIILANIHTDSNIEIKGGNDKPSLIIIYDQQENPRKYFKDMHAVNALLDEEQYIYCKLLGRINKETNGKIIFNILIDLQNAVKEAILYNKDLSLIIDEKTQ